ncbi:MAG: radical SAM protein [Desulfobulbaceae bacterium]|nr:radical SAM protein [Desulfobulbaceae bacterium]
MPTEQSLALSELFFSLQGESTYAGLPCVFIRLAGCNLRCRYCDARYTYEEIGGNKSLSEIIAFVDLYPEAIVEITGGEPMLQENVIPLMQRLVDQKRTVLLETNGSIDLSSVPDGVTIIIDVKCPDSGMAHANRLENLTTLNKSAEIKFVLCSRKDYDWAVACAKAHNLIDCRNGRALRPVLFSPVSGYLPPAELAAWILQDKLAVRLQLQLHKILWPESDRGV